MPEDQKYGSILCIAELWRHTTLYNTEKACLKSTKDWKELVEQGIFFHGKQAFCVFQVGELTLVYSSFTDMVLPPTSRAAFPRLTRHYSHFTRRFVSFKVGGISENFRSACSHPGRVSLRLGVASSGARNRPATPSRCFLLRLITRLPCFLLESRHLNATRVKTGNDPWSR